MTRSRTRPTYDELAALVEHVEIRVDGGFTWRPAVLERAGRRGWARFAYSSDSRPGRFEVMSRATDERRLRQPATAPWNAKGYLQNGVHRVGVIVSE